MTSVSTSSSKSLRESKNPKNKTFLSCLGLLRNWLMQREMVSHIISYPSQIISVQLTHMLTIESWRIPLGDSGLLDYVLSTVPVADSEHPLNKQTLRLVGNACADCGMSSCPPFQVVDVPYR
jgi:hypothetical protein